MLAFIGVGRTVVDAWGSVFSLFFLKRSMVNVNGFLPMMEGIMTIMTIMTIVIWTVVILIIIMISFAIHLFCFISTK